MTKMTLSKAFFFRRALLVSAWLTLGARLPAQSTGIFVNSAGYVGIGTTAPVQALDLRGSAGAPAASGTIQNGLLRFEQSADFGILDLGVRAGGAGAWLQSGNLSTLAVTYPLLLNPNGGNVGIGTMAPSLPLDVKGTNLLARFESTASSALIYFMPNGQKQWRIGTGSVNVGDFGIRNDTDGIEAISINAAGNVGIGTTSPQYALDVPNGEVHAQGFVAPSQTYADFVFKPGYKLAPLSAVEDSIKKEGHLPGIPSEAEAKAHGIDLAQMQVKLLQKIEELTLLMIQEDKTVRQQSQELQELKAENAAMQARLNANPALFNH